MPKKKSTTSYDAVGGIFDFIFQEAEKPIDKRRPITPTGISAEGMLSDALVSALEKPGVFISDTIVKEYNDALDIKIADVNFGTQGSLSFSTGKIVDLIKDPAGYVDSAITRAKAQRKASRIRFLGEAMDDFLHTAVAHKYGDLEAKEIALANTAANEKVESYRVSRAVGQSVRITTSGDSSEFMVNRSVDLIGRKTLGATWDTMSDADRKEFRDVLYGREGYSQLERHTDASFKTFTKSGKPFTDFTPAPTVADVQRFLAGKYGTTEARAFARAVHVKGPTDKVDLEDPDLYKSLERDYLTARIARLGTPARGSDDEKKLKTYTKSLGYINLKTRSQIDDLKNQLNDPKISSAKKTEIRQAIRDGETAIRMVGGTHGLINVVGQWEGYLNSLNTVWGGVMGAPALVPSILNGDFFDARKNTLLNPMKEKKEKIGGVEILRAKYKYGYGANFSNTFNAMGETLYYMTPKSVFRTLFLNGEGFALLLGKNLDQITNASFFGSSGLNAKDLFDQFNELNGSSFKTYVSNTLLHARGRMRPEDFAKLEKLLKRSEKLKNLTFRFGAIGRMKDAIDKIVKTRMKKVRARFVRMLLKNQRLKNWLIKTGATKILGQWIAKGGVQVLAKSIVTAIMGIAGQALTPVGSIIVSALTWIVTDLLLKLMKFGLEAAKLMLMGVIALLILVGGFGLGALKKANKQTFSYTHVPPGQVVSCDKYDLSLGGEDPEEPIDPSLPTDCVGGESVQDVFARAKEYVSSTYGSVGTSLVLINCPGHHMCDDIGWAWCYSADAIYCKADKLGGASCEYIFELSVHELLHQIQGWGGCSTDMREWGADYLSSNGGGYTFQTPSGCKKATEVSTAGCTAEQAKNAALCWDTGTTCFSNISSQILSRFCN